VQPALPPTITPNVVAGSPLAVNEALVEAERAAAVEALPWSECKFVASTAVCGTRGGRWHRVSADVLAGHVSSFTACGWRFEGSHASLVDVIPPHMSHKLFCAKCFPDRKALAQGSV
jgi:hypothetical protein